MSLENKNEQELKERCEQVGVFLTKNNTYQAYIEVNKKRKTKNFDNKEDAVLMRYVWELNNWGANAPQLKEIGQDYPILLSAINKSIRINENINIVKAILKHLSKDKHCPCRIIKTPDTICMCKEFRDMIERGETGFCHCGLWIAEEN